MIHRAITLDALAILDAIERRGSFARAAEELDKATSALSYTVQKLEEQLGITLFQRQGRRSVLTPAGRLVLEDGRKILSATHALADRARELANGWEPRLRIALETTLDRQRFFQVLEGFLVEHQQIEIDICESVLNGGWEALAQDRIDLAVGVPGPVPQQKGFRAVPVMGDELVAVVAAHHFLARCADDPDTLKQQLPKARRIVTHDTSRDDVVRSAGLVGGRQVLYVQTIDQKIDAQLQGLGVGHLPRHRIAHLLASGQLVELAVDVGAPETFIAWKLSHKGKALQKLAQRLMVVDWSFPAGN